MKLVLPILLALSLCSSALAQPAPATYTFTMTPDEANLTLNKLGELPWKEVNPLLQKLIGQINAQNKPPPAAAPVAPHIPADPSE